MPRLLALGLVFAAAGCGQSDNEPGPGGVTVGEARALDEAAEMIEARRLPPDPAGSASGAAATGQPAAP